MYEGCTRNAYHLYMFCYKSEAFGGLPRAKFLHALDAEGIPCSPGYSPLNKEPFLPVALGSKGFRRLFPKDVLDGYQERNQCPASAHNRCPLNALNRSPSNVRQYVWSVRNPCACSPQNP